MTRLCPDCAEATDLCGATSPQHCVHFARCPHDYSASACMTANAAASADERVDQARLDRDDYEEMEVSDD